MYCRKCMRKGKKINMKTDIENRRYICLECENIVEWTIENQRQANYENGE